MPTIIMEVDARLSSLEERIRQLERANIKSLQAMTESRQAFRAMPKSVHDHSYELGLLNGAIHVARQAQENGRVS